MQKKKQKQFIWFNLEFLISKSFVSQHPHESNKHVVFHSMTSSSGTPDVSSPLESCTPNKIHVIFRERYGAVNHLIGQFSL